MAITNGTNVTALEKPAVGIDTGPGWATAINNSIDAVDGHDHSSSKGIRITPAAINISADLEYNQNSATELKNVVFDSTVTAATTPYSLYQSSGNLFFRDGSGTQIQMTITGSVNSGAGSITGMASTDAVASYSDSSKTFNFFTNGVSTYYGKMAHADLVLYKYNISGTNTDYVIIQANSGVSGNSGTLLVPSESATLLTTATNFAGAINVATSNSNNPINLKPNGTGHVVIGNAGATGKVTSNGAYDLILSTNSGTNSSTIAITDAADGSISFIPNGSGEIVIGSGAASGKITSSGAHDLVLDTNAGTNSGSITITDAADGNIDITPNGSGEVNISKVDINGGTLAAITIDGNWTAVSQTCANLGSVTTADINGGTLAAITIDGNWTAASQTCANLGAVTTTGTIGLGGKLTAGSTEIEGSNFDITGGTISGTTVGAASHTTGKFTTCDATTDFTIGGLKVTDGNIADTGTLAIVPVDGCTIALGSDAGDDFNIDSGKLVVEGDTGYVGINTATPVNLLEIIGNHATHVPARIRQTNTSNTAQLLHLINDSTHSYAGALNCVSSGSNRSFTSTSYTPNDTLRTANRLYGLLAVGHKSSSAGEATAFSINKADGATNVFNVDFNGDVEYVGSINDISDKKLKENIVDATPKLEELLKVKIRNFNFKEGVLAGDEADKKRIGVVAQELEAIWPSMIIDRPDYAEDGDTLTGTVTKRVRQDVFTPIIIKAIQELSAKVTALENA